MSQRPVIHGIEEGDGEVTLSLEIPADLEYFDGHFPQTPILPGVVQVHWAMVLGHEYLDLPSRFAGMEVVKFQEIIRPQSRVELNLRFDAGKGKLYFSYMSSGGRHASGRILLQ